MKVQNTRDNDIHILKTQFDELGISYTEGQIYKLIAYMNHILEWNKKVNLTAITDRDEFLIKHVVDSLLVVNLPEFAKGKTVLDIGTGGGFPGIPLAVMCPEKKFYLVDSLLKRIRIINQGIDELGLTNVETLHSRAEDLIKLEPYKRGLDVVVSRAVANMKKLSGYMLPYVKAGGVAIALKGPAAEDELVEAEEQIISLGGKNFQVRHIPANGYNHSVIIIEK